MADSYISEAKFGAPHKPPAFSKPRPPPASPMRKTNNVRTPRRVIGSSGRGLPSLDGSSNRMRTI